MSTSEIILSINNLSIQERLWIIESVLQSVKEANASLIEQAVSIMQDDYLNDKDLADLTTLDLESFYETR